MGSSRKCQMVRTLIRIVPGTRAGEKHDTRRIVRQHAAKLGRAGRILYPLADPRRICPARTIGPRWFFDRALILLGLQLGLLRS